MKEVPSLEASRITFGGDISRPEHTALSVYNALQVSRYEVITIMWISQILNPKLSDICIE
jgi:hypothetical protein